MKMLAGGLEDLLIDFKTPHQKLPELVKHKDIAALMNMNRFNVEELLKKYPDVKQYLKHDVLGLLEAMDIFSSAIFAR